MPEPTTAGAAGFAGWKLAGGAAGFAAGGAGLAALVVMCMTPPRSKREWVSGLVSTVIGSIGGGAWVIKNYGLESWSNDYMGLVAILGVVFACGLPAWAIVRWSFNYIDSHKNSDIHDVAKDLKDIVVGGGSETV